MSDTNNTPPSTRAGLITLDLSAWPQIQVQVTAGIPLANAIAACELAIQQLRDLQIEAEVQKRVRVALLEHPLDTPLES